jgi:hypothetical protein
VNPTQESLRQSYADGRQLARLQGLLDLENELDDALAAQPHLKSEIARLRAEQGRSLPQRDVWYAMYLSGMLPMEHFDRPMVQAYDHGKAVSFVDMPMHAVQDFARCVPFGGLAWGGSRSCVRCQSAAKPDGLPAPCLTYVQARVPRRSCTGSQDR